MSPDPRKQLAKQIQSMSHRHHTWQVFRDFVEASAIAISNAVDLIHFDERETRYLELVKRYDAGEIREFTHMLGSLVLAMENEDAAGSAVDVLGQVFMELELGSKWAGQFFTPQHLCDVMAQITIDQGDLARTIKRRGFVTVSEPAVGGGAMLIGFANHMRQCGFNYQTQMHATGVDVDLTAVHMTYLQLSLLNVPAIIVHGNTLAMKEYSRWYTPAHLLGFWTNKLNRPHADAPALSIETARQSATTSRATERQLEAVS